MCSTCGCGDSHHHHDHDHVRQIDLEKDILDINNHYAQQNRDFLNQRHSIGFNFVSSPGSGKTTLLEKTIRYLTPQYPIAVIEGDQHTDLDAQRIRQAGAKARQINTGKSCHLDAHMVGHALQELNIGEGGFVFIENVGNLICPAMFDLGEHYRVAIISTTEGDDKPLKYPDMFYGADVVIVNKTDLLPYVNFDLECCVEAIRKISSKAELFFMSADNLVGVDLWIDWLKNIHLLHGEKPSLSR
ncbi:MAG: hydrogenase nickel incorporation protein HypB [Francisellaceae bacterium]